MQSPEQFMGSGLQSVKEQGLQFFALIADSLHKAHTGRAVCHEAGTGIIFNAEQKGVYPVLLGLHRGICDADGVAVHLLGAPFEGHVGGYGGFGGTRSGERLAVQHAQGSGAGGAAPRIDSDECGRDEAEAYP